MENFKEWLSDYLRYFMLAAAAFLLFGIIVIATNIYRSTRQQDSQENIQIITETDTEPAVDTQDTLQSDTDTQSEINTDLLTEKKSDTGTEIATNHKEDNKIDNKIETEAVIATETEIENEMQTYSENETEITAETESQTEAQTEIQTETEYIPKYKTLIGSCYIRSEPSMEAEILGEYIYGTTVEFLEDVGGWYKVQIDGMTGYMGARFFED